MRKFLILLFLFASLLPVSAQILMGDMNDDDNITTSDITAVVNTALGKTAKRYVNAYDANNTSIVGTWTSTSGSVTFNEDGTTSLGTGYTYKFRPMQGRIMVYNASGVLTNVLNAMEVESNYLVLSQDGESSYTYYYKGGQVSGITLSQTSIAGETGQTYQLIATVTPSDAAIPAMTWTSSNTSVATVSESGLVTIVGGGTATITASAQDGSGMTASCTITVPVPVSSITLDKTSLSLDVDENYTLTATVLPANADNTAVTWESSDEDVAMVTSKGKVVAVDYGTATITCTAKDGSGVTATCTVKVEKPLDANGHAYVDMGITDDDGNTVYFATMNVGASSPEDYGDYFAWGETTGYNSGKTTFSWSTYTLCNGSSSTMTRYCTSSSYGTVDNQTVLDAADDAASVNWGGDWRMPDDAELTKLRTTCTWTWNSTKGGYDVTATNGNCIFLPAAGYRYDSSLISAGSYGHYWSRTLSSSRSYYAYLVYFYSSNISRGSGYRYNGLSVRPVLAR